MNLQVKTISRCGYSNCVELKNHDVAITIEPNCGGRIIEYSFRGENIIYLNPQEDGYLLKSGKPPLSD